MNSTPCVAMQVYYFKQRKRVLSIPSPCFVIKKAADNNAKGGRIEDEIQ